MRFSIFSTLLLSSTALAAPLASSTGSSLPSTSSAAALVKTLHSQLESGASNIKTTLSSVSDKTAAISQVTTQMHNMTSNVQATLSYFGGSTDTIARVAKRAEALALAIDIEGKPVLHLPEKRDHLAADASGKASIVVRDSSSDAIAATELVSEMSGSVDSVQDAVQQATEKLGTDNLMGASVPLFSTMSSLNSIILTLIAQV